MSREITKFPLITDNSSTKQETSFEKQKKKKKIFRLSNKLYALIHILRLKLQE